MKRFLITFIIISVFTQTLVLGADEVYIVEKGDTLWNISRIFNINFENIIADNPQFENPDLIYPEDKVYINYDSSQNDYVSAGIDNINYDKNYSNELIKFINDERKKNNLNPLEVNENLNETAQKKCEDMAINQYFSHTSPSYGTPFEMLKEFNINYSIAGENIARKQKNPKEVFDDWLNVEGHKKNILNPNFTQIGAGYFKDDLPYWTVIFIK